MEKKQTIIVSGILESSDGVLLAKRPLTKKIAPGIYHLPGGHVEFGEDPEIALAREFKEEFFLDIRVENIIRIFSYVRGDEHSIEISYKVSTKELPDIIKFDRKETESVHWATKVTLKDYLPENDHDYITLENYFIDKK